MNWKILGKSLLITIGVLCVIGTLLFLVIISPLWVSIAGIVLIVFYLVYDGMRRRNEMGNPNDRMSWNNDYSEEDEEDEV